MPTVDLLRMALPFLAAWFVVVVMFALDDAVGLQLVHRTMKSLRHRRWTRPL